MSWREHSQCHFHLSSSTQISNSCQNWESSTLELHYASMSFPYITISMIHHLSQKPSLWLSNIQESSSAQDGFPYRVEFQILMVPLMAEIMPLRYQKALLLMYLKETNENPGKSALACANYPVLSIFPGVWKNSGWHYSPCSHTGPGPRM